MFKWIILMFMIVSLSVQADEVRISVLWVHYSVGRQFVTAGCHINEQLDTLTIEVGNDHARVVFRDYYTNYEKPDQNYSALTDTLHENCDRITIDNFDYDLMSPYNRIIINYNETSKIHSGILDYMFNVPNKEQQGFWKVFTKHNIPSSSGDSVNEKYDLIIIKNPYLAWFDMTPEMSDSIKMFYEDLRDSIVNHPEINVALAFGTPLILGHACDDSSVAKITYELCEWFASDLYFTHNNFGTHRNLWKFDCYSHLCEMAELPNRYCLKTAYNGGGGSHLSELGEGVSQDSLVAFIKRAARDILILKSETPPPEDTIPPATINDLGAVTGDEIGEVVLDWIAPGDDSNIGQVQLYEVRYSQSMITADNYNQATVFPTPPNPLPAGIHQELTVTSLLPGVEYFFAIRAYDDEGLVSEISNVPSAIAKNNPDPGDITPPSAIIDLHASTGENMGEVFLDWTAPGDDGDVGQADSYEVRFSVNSINIENYYEASVFPALLNPSPAGSAQELVVISLSPGEEYFFAIRVYDDAGLVSNLSNVPSAVSQLDLGTGDSTVSGIHDSPHPYPNPYNPSSGTILSFTNVPDGSNLTIITVSGGVIRKWENTFGDVRWNGRDDSNNMVASGVYLWYIENSDNRGKIVVRR